MSPDNIFRMLFHKIKHFFKYYQRFNPGRLMENSNFKDLQRMNATLLSCTNLKKHVADMLENSSHCKAILECVNQDTGEYRIVLEGIIETEAV